MEPNFNNSDKLLTDASKGEIVLFLGSGINIGCNMGNPFKKAPLGNMLSEDISNYFFSDEQYNGESLRAVSEKVQNIENKKKMRDYLVKRLHPVELSSALLFTILLLLFFWENLIFILTIDIEAVSFLMCDSNLAFLIRYDE